MNSLKVLKIKNHQNLKINDYFTVMKLKHTAPDCNVITITSINNFLNVSKKNSQNIIVGATAVSPTPFFMIDYDREFYADSEKYKNIDLKINRKCSKSTSKF